MSGQMAQTSGRPEPFRLLFVCTGNICRSPFAQLHTRALLDVRLGPAWARWFSVASAGTGAVVGSAMHPETRAFFGTRAGHADVEAFRARQLPARDVRLADLVLTASRRHRSAVLELEPRALRTTFTLREFVRLLGAVDRRELPLDPLSRARALVEAARDQRGMLPPVPAEDDAVPDPISGGEQDHASATSMIDAAVQSLVAAIADGVTAVPVTAASDESDAPDPKPEPDVAPTHPGSVRLGADPSEAPTTRRTPKVPESTEAPKAPENAAPVPAGSVAGSEPSGVSGPSVR